MGKVVIRLDNLMLRELDRVARALRVRLPGPRGRSGKAGPLLSRSELVLLALHEFIGRIESLEHEKRERRVFAKHRELLAREAAALVAEQAKP